MYKLDYVTMAGATVATDTETFETKEAALRKGLAQIADGYAFNLISTSRKVKRSILKDIFFRGRS